MTTNQPYAGESSLVAQVYASLDDIKTSKAADDLENAQVAAAQLQVDLQAVGRAFRSVG